MNGAHALPWQPEHAEDVAGCWVAGGALVGGTAWTMTGTASRPARWTCWSSTRPASSRWPTRWPWPRPPAGCCCWATRSSCRRSPRATHPEPVDESALGWLSAGHATLPPELGYFLADSWRMHPELCRAVSVLSYDGRLESAPAAFLRQPGRSCRPAWKPSSWRTAGNSHVSPEEAAEVVSAGAAAYRAEWTPGEGERRPRPAAAEDILVVAAYNAQVQLIRQQLDHAGLPGRPGGHGGQVPGPGSSRGARVHGLLRRGRSPRGVEFLLNRNRINVAVSRGQWRAVIVRSPELTNYMPARPAGLEELGAFTGLCDCAA